MQQAPFQMQKTGTAAAVPVKHLSLNQKIQLLQLIQKLVKVSRSSGFINLILIEQELQ